MFEIYTTIITLLALLGVVLNIKKDIRCFYIWTFTNVSWAMIDFYMEIYAQGVLFTIYTALAIYGIWSWNTKKEESNVSQNS